MDWSREPMQVLVKRFDRRGTITEYDLLSALDRNPTIINAGADICAEAKSTILAQAERIEDLEAKLAKAVEALDEAVYLLAPTEKDMERKAGVYRIVITLAELTGAST